MALSEKLARNETVCSPPRGVDSEIAAPPPGEAGRQLFRLPAVQAAIQLSVPNEAWPHQESTLMRDRFRGNLINTNVFF